MFGYLIGKAIVYCIVSYLIYYSLHNYVVKPIVKAIRQDG